MLYLSQIVENETRSPRAAQTSSGKVPVNVDVSPPRDPRYNPLRRELENVSSPGTSTGAEASSPTGDAGCLGNAGWRRLVPNSHG